MRVGAHSLSFVGKCLSLRNDPASILALRNQIENGRVDWRSVLWHAGTDLVTPALWAELDAKGLAEVVPREVSELLKDMLLANRERNQKLRSLACELIGDMNRIGVEPILLKGARHLFDSAYRDPGARLMLDLDVLVPEGQLMECVRVLEAKGFEIIPDHRSWTSFQHHYPALHRSGDVSHAELHRFVLAEPASKVLPHQAAWRDSVPLEIPGLRARGLSPAHRLLHNVLHSEIQQRNNALQRISLQQLYDLAVTSERHRGDDCWGEVASVMRGHGLGKVLGSYVYLAERLLGMSVPDELDRGAGPRHYAACLHCLRWPRLNWWTRRLLANAERFTERVLREQGFLRDGVSVTRARLRLTRHLVGRWHRVLAGASADGA